MIDFTTNDYQCSITITVTILTCWLLQEILERKCGLHPAITTTSQFNKIYDSKADPDKYITNKRMSRQLDLDGNYRITARGSILFIKAMFCVYIAILWTYLFLKNNCKFFIDHFIYFNQESVHDPILKNTSASIAAFYIWELAADKYGKIAWSTLSHHIIAIIAALFIFLGSYNPFALWYGYMGIACCFPMTFALAFRNTFSNIYPEYTRNAFKFLYYYYGFTCVINFCGQLFLIIYGGITNKIEIWGTVAVLFSCCVWGYDDRNLIRALKEFGKMKYELVDILVGNRTNTVKNN